jgi:FHA domain
MELDEAAPASTPVQPADDIIRSGGKFGYQQGDPYRLKHAIVDGRPAYALVEGLIKETPWIAGDPLPVEGDEDVTKIQFVIRSVPFSIGRAASHEVTDNGFFIGSKKVSSVHCVLDFDRKAKGWILETEAKNGMWLNREVLQPESGKKIKAPLPSGSTFRIGPFFGYFLLPADAVGKSCTAPGITSLDQELYWTQTVGITIPDAAKVSTSSSAPAFGLGSALAAKLGGTPSRSAQSAAAAAAAATAPSDGHSQEISPLGKFMMASLEGVAADEEREAAAKVKAAEKREAERQRSRSRDVSDAEGAAGGAGKERSASAASGANSSLPPHPPWSAVVETVYESRFRRDSVCRGWVSVADLVAAIRFDYAHTALPEADSSIRQAIAGALKKPDSGFFSVDVSSFSELFPDGAEKILGRYSSLPANKRPQQLYSKEDPSIGRFRPPPKPSQDAAGSGMDEVVEP